VLPHRGQAGEVILMPRVLLVENDAQLAELLQVVLSAQGYQVATLPDTSTDAVQAAVERCHPDCVILDGSGPLDYGESWATAAWLHQRQPPVPTIMLTSYVHSAEEARAGVTPRSQVATFAAVLVKPLQLTDLLTAVARAVPPEAVPPEAVPPALAELQAEIVTLRAALADREREIARLQQLAARCCPWREQPWHRSH
jgi:CheY-like chemotaxis protein